VLRLFYTFGRGAELDKTLDWVIGVLRHRAYLDGTRYYCTPEAFLYFFHQLLQAAPSLRVEHGNLLLARTLERVGALGDAIALAMRILILNAHAEEDAAAVAAARELRELRALQSVDGGWKSGFLYAYGGSRARIGSRGLATAFAVAALRGATGSPAHAQSLPDNVLPDNVLPGA
jgi:hypothetical protein